MNYARGGHGVLGMTGQLVVYVFGSHKSHPKDSKCQSGASETYTGKSCEKFHLTLKTWKELPSMKKPRWNFNPCEFQSVIYLCGSGEIEAFSPATDSFLPFQLTTPRLNHFCCVYVDSDLLVVHSRDIICRFTAGPEAQLRQISETQCAAASKGQNSQPVVDRTSRLFYLVCDGECFTFSMDTGAKVLVD